MEHLLFVFLQHAGLLTRRHEHFELFFRVHQSMTAGGLQPEDPDDRPAHGVQGADERFEKSRRNSSVGLANNQRRLSPGY